MQIQPFQTRADTLAHGDGVARIRTSRLVGTDSPSGDDHILVRVQEAHTALESLTDGAWRDGSPERLSAQMAAIDAREYDTDDYCHELGHAHAAAQWTGKGASFDYSVEDVLSLIQRKSALLRSPALVDASKVHSQHGRTRFFGLAKYRNDDTFMRAAFHDFCAAGSRALVPARVLQRLPRG